MHEILQKIGAYGIVPVIKIENAAQAVPLAKALVEGGLPLAEITFRTAAAADAIAAISEEVPEMLVGAGTVLTIEQADRAAAAGAKFIVSPGLNPRVVQHCIDIGIPVTPGVNSPSDMELAMEMGLDVVKFFPAEQSGGVNFLKAVSGPYSGLHFMPTGGVNLKNLNDYLSFNKVLACGGTWLVKADMLAAGDYAGITALAKEAVHQMLGFELAHIGIHCANEAEAEKSAKLFCTIFGLPCKAGNSSVFAGDAAEFMKSPYPGTHGHIAIRTNSVERAEAHLKARGIAFREDSRKSDGKNTKAIYLSDEICGFAVHLVAR